MAPSRSGRPFPQRVKGINPGMTQGGNNFPPNQHQQIQSSSTVDTSVREDTTANMKRTTIAMAIKVMKREETSVFLGELIGLNLGTREVENFVKNQEKLRYAKDGVCMDEGSMKERERVMVGSAMENKLASSLAKGIAKRGELMTLKNKLYWRMKREEDRRTFRNRMNEEIQRERGLQSRGTIRSK